MQDIIDLERRITAALERIAKSVKDHPAGQGPTSPSGAADPAADSSLQDLLDEERMANAQLQERLRMVGEREAAQLAQHERQTETLQAEHAAQVATLTAQVEEISQELARLTAVRQSESEEISDIVAALNPLIEEARHA